MARPGECVHCGEPLHCEHGPIPIPDTRYQHIARVMTEDGIVVVSGSKPAIENHIAFVKRNQGK